MATLNRTVEKGSPFDAFVMPEAKRDGVPPAKRLAEHLASKAHMGPDPGGTVRVTMRAKRGGEKGAEAPLVRSMYDIANKPTRRKRRRKERKA